MNGLADLFYPHACLGCQRLTRGGLCKDCIQQMPRVGPPLCDRCGFATAAAASGCGECRGRSFAFDRARQAVIFGSVVRKVIHRYKYSSERALAKPLALLLAEVVLPLEAGAVTWIPPARDRMRKRGFDHSRLLAQQVSRQSDIPAARLLERTRATQAQMTLEPHLRRENLSGAFSARRTRDFPSRILVVDDVFTTGATASEAARALKAGGAIWVGVVCVARSLPPGAGGAL